MQRKYRRMEAKIPPADAARGKLGTPQSIDSPGARDNGGLIEATRISLAANARFLAGKFVRFGPIGLLSAAVYSIAVAALVSLLKLDGKFANVIGYLVALPLNFVGHRHFTFGSTSTVSREAIRFCFMHVVNIGVSTVGFGILVDGMKLPFWVGILSALVLVPISTFIIMDVWVFAEQGSPFVHD